MKRKKSKIVRIFPMLQPERTALWVALDLLHFVIGPHDAEIDYRVVCSLSDSLSKLEPKNERIELHLTKNDIRTSAKALDFAWQYLDGKTLYFDCFGPEWIRISSEIKAYEPIIRNVRNHFAAAMRDLSETT